MGILKKGITAPIGDEAHSEPQGFMDRLAMLVSSGIGVGYVPVAAGTFGSLWGPLLYHVLPDCVFSLVLLYGTPVVALLGVLSASRCERFWGHDPGRVVVDEVAGMMVTLLFLPLNAAVVWTGFLLFRLFDIFKPQPVGIAERLPRGWGVMADDIVAGVYANLILQVLVRTVPMLQ